MKSPKNSLNKADWKVAIQNLAIFYVPMLAAFIIQEQEQILDILNQANLNPGIISAVGLFIGFLGYTYKLYKQETK